MKLLIGGSPCTHWSIAQTKNREVTAEGIGWELFLNYRIARDKYQPDYFLYENNKSMSSAIREQITAELGVEPVLINSALVSAQNRQRLYWVGRRNPDGTYSQVAVEQPVDRGILLRDILESGVCCGNGGGCGAKTGLYAVPIPEPVNETVEGKAHCLRATYYKDGIRNLVGNTVDRKTCVAIPVPAAGRIVGRRVDEQGHRDDYNEAIPHFQYFEVNEDPQKTNCLTTVQKDNMIAVPVRVGAMPNRDGELGTSQSRLVIEAADGKQMPVYEVRGGYITIKGKTYPIKLADGFYVIRKLTVTECKRLQTVPDTYTFPVSDTQAYKMLGNGWTVDVIAHIMSHFLGLTKEPVEVLSMYDGMGCGHIALNKLGAKISTYYATEIDKYAIQTTQHNFPDTVQLGDAFQVRDTMWSVRKEAEHEPTARAAGT